MKYARLKKSGDFQKLFKSGKRVYSHNLTVIYRPSAKTVMGICISKKYGKAVKRNRIKRLIRAAFSDNVQKLKGKYTIIIMPKICEEYSYADMERGIVTCFGRMEK